MRSLDIMKAMELSATAYRDVQPTLPNGSCFEINDPDSDVQCYLRKEGDCLSITFRGSNSWIDWKTNFAFRRKVIPYGNTVSKIRVHTGFLTAYKSPGVRDVIHGMISSEIRLITISGHSLGGALAVLCGVDLEYHFPDKDYEVLLFGAPRVGNRAFRNSYNKRIFKTLRIENGNDIVTKLPFACMGYRHIGIGIHIGKPKLPFFFSLKAHHPQSYYKNLLKLTRWK